MLLLAFQPAHGTEISAATSDADGILVHDVKSPFQPGTTLIRVLLPDRLDKTTRYPVVCVLPGEAGTESRYENGRRARLSSKRKLSTPKVRSQSPLPVLRERVRVRVYMLRGKEKTLTPALSRSTGRGRRCAVQRNKVADASAFGTTAVSRHFHQPTPADSPLRA